MLVCTSMACISCASGLHSEDLVFLCLLHRHQQSGSTCGGSRQPRGADRALCRQPPPPPSSRQPMARQDMVQQPPTLPPTAVRPATARRVRRGRRCWASAGGTSRASCCTVRFAVAHHTTGFVERFQTSTSHASRGELPGSCSVSAALDPARIARQKCSAPGVEFIGILVLRLQQQSCN